MRQFVGGLCCAIVGLEVLIGVPLVTCALMFALWEGGGIPPVELQVHTASAPADFAPPVPCPPPPISFPQPGMPVSIPAPSFPQPATCPPPPTTADACPPLSPATEAIAEARARNSSPLAGTIIEPDSATTYTAANEFIATVERLATEVPAMSVCPPEDQVCRREPLGLPNPLANGVGNQPIGPGSVAQSLKQAAHSLYARASELEIAGDFSRSDRIRRLAREIHEQIDCLAGEANPAAPVPATSTAVPAESSGYLPSASIPRNPLVPAQAELVPASPLPDQPTILRAASFVPDHPEAELVPLPAIDKPAEKPAP